MRDPDDMPSIIPINTTAEIQIRGSDDINVAIVSITSIIHREM